MAGETFTYEEDKNQAPAVCNLTSSEVTERNVAGFSFEDTICDEGCQKIGDRYFSELNDTFDAEKSIIVLPFEDEELSNELKARTIMVFIASQAIPIEGGGYDFSYNNNSGTIINEDSILTTLHGVQRVINGDGSQDLSKLYLYDPEGIRLNINDIQPHPTHDMAIIKFEPTNSTRGLGQINTSSDTTGELVSLGFTRGAEEGETTGFSYDFYSGTTRNIFKNFRNRNNTDILTPGTAEPGDSGGGMFNKKGELVGVLTNIDCPTIFHNGYTRSAPISRLNDFPE